MQGLETDRPLRQAGGERGDGEQSKDRKRFGDANENARRKPGAAALRAALETRALGALDHAAHGGPGAAARSNIKPTDQAKLVLRAPNRASDAS